MRRSVSGKPDWIRFKIPGGETYTRVKRVIREKGLHTVCLEAGCPNIGECFGCGTATFLIMGNTCTRDCLYCSVSHGVPEPPDRDEPEKIAEAIKSLGLNYAVITSVTRDDLYDGGASLFAETVRAIKRENPRCSVEILIPDFRFSPDTSLEDVLSAEPDVLNHNIEVVASLYETLRPAGSYGLSLDLLSRAAGTGIPVKSGLMVGFGEDIDDIEKTMRDLRKTGCSILTVGQYLQSRKDGYPVKKYYTPVEFERIAAMARSMGFTKVMSGPQVRSSYHAADMG